MRCLLGIALVAVLVAPAAHAKDGRLYLEAAYQHVFFNDETDNTVGGLATTSETDYSVMVLRAGYDLPPAFTVETMLGLGNGDVVVRTPISQDPFESRINHSVGIFGKLWTSPYRGAGVHSRVGVPSVATGTSVTSFATSCTSDVMACGAGSHVAFSDAPNLHLDAILCRSDGDSKCPADGIVTAFEA